MYPWDEGDARAEFEKVLADIRDGRRKITGNELDPFKTEVIERLKAELAGSEAIPIPKFHKTVEDEGDSDARADAEDDGEYDHDEDRSRIDERAEHVLDPRIQRELAKQALDVIKIVKAYALEPDSTKAIAMTDMLIEDSDLYSVIDGFLYLFEDLLIEIEFLTRPLKPRTVLNRLARKARKKIDELGELE